MLILERLTMDVKHQHRNSDLCKGYVSEDAALAFAQRSIYGNYSKTA